ncbi:hypothetical protein PRIPAC_90629 [Pristionchus pacificus]|uniref:G protein-coupled receptor n=1 Tax=Pristionchus pacificus TaxID=54126 RepID=A0A2A6CXY9_PRIPA|nr:hypothetical protein PRIPAC_90629 [Pristionchus pacificus]|eukprot:PDM83029.1 G protein-coupled receptor [Pristionchus pacificus]
MIIFNVIMKNVMRVVITHTIVLELLPYFKLAVQLRFLPYTLEAPEYNCSAYTPEEWTELYGTPQTVLGLWSLTFATICQILYFPSLLVFYRERRMTCYKGWRSSLCMLIIFLYGSFVTLFTRLVYPNSPHTTVAFEPFIPGHTVEEFIITAGMITIQSVHGWLIELNAAIV